MKKLFFWLATFLVLMTSPLLGQSTFSQGFRYQAMLRDSAGQALGNKETELIIRIIGQDKFQDSFYSELHRVKTSPNGLFELTIGQGIQKNGALSELPWAEQQLWLQIEMKQEKLPIFSVVSKSPLMAVPYALHAANAAALFDPIQTTNEPIEKSGAQSIYWTTSGNLGTNPNVHFVGSRDNVNVIFKTNGKAYMTLTPIGKLELISDVPAGPDNLKSSYPVVVEGTQNIQGVWVEINGSRSKANNFVTFADDNGIQGRIEGQTLSELEKSDAYVTQVAVTTLNSVALVSKLAELYLKIVSEGVSAAAAAVVCGLTFGLIACPDIAALSVGATAAIAKAAVWTVELASYLTVTGTSFDRIRSKVGVSYSSGSGDYAEWMMRNPKEIDMVYGEIVGVNGGIVTRNTTSNRNMVISQYPAFLGKTPSPESEQNFEKVAFMGQVPVRVIGKVKSGDFILPSGKNDGLGIAIHPEDMSISDYSKMVGIAWESVDNHLAFNLVNVAVGLKTNHLAGKVDELESKVNNIMNFLEGKSPLHPSDSVAYSTQSSVNMSSSSVALPSGISFEENQNLFSNDEYDRMVDQNAGYLKLMVANVEQKLIAQGSDISHPAIVKLFKDPVNTLKEMHRNPKEFAEWALTAH
jgi:hypothetical protein